MSTTTISPVAGPALLLGEQPALVFVYVLAPGVRAAVTGTFKSSLTVALHPAHASASFTPSTPGALHGPQISPAAGSASFSGKTSSVTVAPSQIHPLVGAAVFTPSTPGVVFGIHPAAGAASFSPSTVALLVTLHPAVHASTATGETPSLGQGVLLSPQFYNALLRGATPTIFKGVIVAPAVHASTFTAESSTLSLGPFLRPGFYNALLRGSTPTIFKGVILAPAAGSAAFTPESPTISRGALLHPGFYNALLRGGQPTIFKGVIVAPAAGAAAFTRESSSIGQTRTLFPWRAGMLFTPGRPTLTPIGAALAAILLRNGPVAMENLAPYFYHVGDHVRLSIEFLDAKGNPLDPATVLITVTPAYAAPPTVSVVRDSTGNYHAVVTLASRGVWFYQWTWTGAAQIGGGKSFVISH